MSKRQRSIIEDAGASYRSSGAGDNSRRGNRDSSPIYTAISPSPWAASDSHSQRSPRGDGHRTIKRARLEGSTTPARADDHIDNNQLHTVGGTNVDLDHEIVRAITTHGSSPPSRGHRANSSAAVSAVAHNNVAAAARSEPRTVDDHIDTSNSSGPHTPKSYFQSSMVAVLVGPKHEAQRYFVHKDLLISKSAYFRDRLETSRASVAPQNLEVDLTYYGARPRIHEINESHFGTIVHWLYAGSAALSKIWRDITGDDDEEHEQEYEQGQEQDPPTTDTEEDPKPTMDTLQYRFRMQTTLAKIFLEADKLRFEGLKADVTDYILLTNTNTPSIEALSIIRNNITGPCELGNALVYSLKEEICRRPETLTQLGGHVGGLGHLDDGTDEDADANEDVYDNWAREAQALLTGDGELAFEVLTFYIQNHTRYGGCDTNANANDGGE